jgi:hypothetical protein
MNITKLNFKYLYPKILHTVKNCNFVALDLEFSGITLTKELINSRQDDIELRYFKIKENIKNFIPLQLGLCGLKVKEQNIKLYPMNFYIFPFANETNFYNKKYLFDMNSINFLVGNNFDFNKTFYDGIRYLSLHERKQMKIDTEMNKKVQEKREEKTFPPEARLFMTTIYNKLRLFFDKFKGQIDNPENLLQMEITYVRKIYIDYLIKNINSEIKDEANPNLFLSIDVDESDILKTMLNIKVCSREIIDSQSILLLNDKNYRKISSWLHYHSMTMEGSDREALKESWRNVVLNMIFTASQMAKRDDKLDLDSIDKLNDESHKFNYDQIIDMFNLRNYENNAIVRDVINTLLSLDTPEDELGFSKLILDLAAMKKPLLFHNGLVDLCQIVDKFIEPLPDSFLAFIELVNKHFPNLYDTKYMIENNASFYNLFPTSSLEAVSTEIMTKNLLDPFKIVIDDSHKGYKLSAEGEGKSHEAGYDAMLTSYTFIFLYKHLFRTPMNIDLNYLQIFKNKMLFSNLQIVCDLDPNNYEEGNRRFEIFVITELPTIISVKEIIEAFKETYGITPIIQKLFAQNIAYIIIPNSKDLEEFTKKCEMGTEKVLSSFIVKNYEKSVNIISYDKYLKILRDNMKDRTNAISGEADI